MDMKTEDEMLCPKCNSIMFDMTHGESSVHNFKCIKCDYTEEVELY